MPQQWSTGHITANLNLHHSNTDNAEPRLSISNVEALTLLDAPFRGFALMMSRRRGTDRDIADNGTGCGSRSSTIADRRSGAVHATAARCPSRGLDTRADVAGASIPARTDVAGTSDRVRDSDWFRA